MAMLLQRVDMKMTHLRTAILTVEKHISWNNQHLTIGFGQIEFSLDLGFVKACVDGFIQIAGSNRYYFFFFFSLVEAQAPASLLSQQEGWETFSVYLGELVCQAACIQHLNRLVMAPLRTM